MAITYTPNNQQVRDRSEHDEFSVDIDDEHQPSRVFLIHALPSPDCECRPCAVKHFQRSRYELADVKAAAYEFLGRNLNH